MPDATNIALQFLPWVRQGLAAGIRDVETQSPTLAPNVSVNVKLWINQATSPTPDVSKTARLYGPGDVTGIDRRQVIRTTPAPFATNFEPNFFPAIEFDRPDFPWLFTPLKADANDRLRPWIVLVVVKKQNGVALSFSPGANLPNLEIKDPASPADELPDLAESWAWAHAQVSVDKDVTVEKALRERPDRTLSRLLCPRRLEPNTAYYACVVPAFVVVKENNTEQLRPAWSLNQAAVNLPVYYSWEFSAGTAGDFEELVEKLRPLSPKDLPSGVGKFQLEFGHADERLPTLEGAILPFTGVLEPVSETPPPDDARLRLYKTELQNVLNAPAATATKINPPIYGGAHAQGADPARPPQVNVTQQTFWLNELNLDPRHRVAAALGTQVIQHEQEDLMAAAWEQLEPIKTENQSKRQRQLAQSLRTTIFENQFKPMQAQFGAQPGEVQVRETLFQITGPAHTRMKATTFASNTFFVELSRQPTPEFGAAALRRLTRPRGALSRRFAAPPAATQQIAAPRQLLKLVPVPRPVKVFPRPRPVGIVTPEKILPGGLRRVGIGRFRVGPRYEEMTVELINQSAGNEFSVYKDDKVVQILSEWWGPGDTVRDNFVAAARDHQARLLRPRFMANLILPPTINAGTFLTRFDPQTAAGAATPGAAFLARGADDALPLLASPEFPQPMYEAIRDLRPEYLLPGLDKVPKDSVTLLQTNQRFIEAFLVGLNHEMARELLWREYPADQRGAYFREFWGSNPTSNTFPPLQEWRQALGKNSGAPTDSNLVLLIRSELLRRYPGTIIYAVKADATGRKPSALPADQRFPSFRGSAPPDVTFIGFTNLKRDEVKQAQPGWFFIIQQQPGEPKFGLDGDGQFGKPVPDWSEIAWRHLVRSPEELQRLKHVSIKPGANQLPDASQLAKPPEWGRNAAHMARITFQKPVRIAIHASLLVSTNA
jgi:hypothetical protein